jgi:hypothetical protein
MKKHCKTVVCKSMLEERAWANLGALRSMSVTFTKFDLDILRLLRFDQLRYVMPRYVTFTLCYATC